MSVAEIFESMDWGPAPESDAPARAWLDARGRRFGPVIGGRARAPGETFETRDPATGEALAEIAQCGAAEVDEAVAAAREAQGLWAALSAHARARHLYALARHLQKHARLLAVLETLDTGKPIRESRDLDVPLAIRHLYHHAGLAQLLPTARPGRAPLGVCAQVIPWNFPLLMAAWKIAPALAAGNTAVLKPAEQTPLSALLLAEIAHEAGLPPGVLNLVTGDGRTGEALVAHGGVDKVAFTGSTAVGRRIREITAGSGKRLTLELGGKSPYVVFEDADLDGAVEGLVDAIWLNGGQVCCAGSRLLVQEGVAGDLHARLRARMERLRVGPPLDKAIDIGAIASPEHRARVLRLLEGAGGTRHVPAAAVPDGYFLPPMLIEGLHPSDPLMQEEIFGPVLVSTTFRTPEEAVRLANDTRYGLAASVWTERLGLAVEMARRIEAGVVWINAANLLDAAAPFGGRRESGFGREGGWEGMEAYTRPLEEASGAGRAPAPRGAAIGPPPAGRIDARAAKTARAKTAGTETAAPEAEGLGAPFPAASPAGLGAREAAPPLPPLDRTAKLYIGGRQVRPDTGASRAVRGEDGRLLGHAAVASRKDVRDAVEAARASPWRRMTGHARAQVLYYLAETLSGRAEAFAARLDASSERAGGREGQLGRTEVEASIERLFHFAAWADKWEGGVCGAPMRGAVLALREPVGVVGALCPDRPALLGLVTPMAAALALGNAAVLVASEADPLTAWDLATAIEASDLPAGAVNLLTGPHAELAPVLAGHMGLDAAWCFSAADLAGEVERISAHDLKRTWTDHGRARDWWATPGTDWLEEASEVKTVWLPSGLG